MDNRKWNDYVFQKKKMRFEYQQIDWAIPEIRSTPKEDKRILNKKFANSQGLDFDLKWES